MKRQIHAYKGHGEIAVEGHNIKLGRGGIREIEFFVQTQQLIAGGRHPELRGRDTLATLRALADGGWISGKRARRPGGGLSLPAHGRAPPADDRRRADADACRPSAEAHRALRALSAALPTGEHFADALLAQLRKVQGHYAHLFETRRTRRRQAAVSSSRRMPTIPHTLDRLPRWAFATPLEIVRDRARLARRPLSRRCAASSRATQLARAHAGICSSSCRARDESATRAFAGLRPLLRGLHAGGGGRLLSLLLQNPACWSLVGIILGNAPRLADILAQHPQVMDALIDPAFSGAMPDEQGARRSARRARSTSAIVRGFPRPAAHVRPGADVPDRRADPVRHAVGGTGRARPLPARRRHHPRACTGSSRTEFAKTHGRVAGQKTRVLALRQARRPRNDGGLRSRSHPGLRFRRDQRRNPTASARSMAAQYFARLTQRLISALTVADQLRRALPGRHAAAPSGPLGAGRDPARRPFATISRTKPGPGSTWR